MKIEDVEASVASEICDELSEDIFTKPLVLAKGDWFECDVCNAWYYLSRTMIHIDNTACLSVVVHNVPSYFSLCLLLRQTAQCIVESVSHLSSPAILFVFSELHCLPTTSLSVRVALYCVLFCLSACMTDETLIQFCLLLTRWWS